MQPGGDSAVGVYFPVVTPDGQRTPPPTSTGRDGTHDIDPESDAPGRCVTTTATSSSSTSSFMTVAPERRGRQAPEQATASDSITLDPGIASSLGLVQAVMEDVAVDAQRLVSELLTPQPAAYFLDTFDGPEAASLGIALTYILGEDDHVMQRPGTDFAARLGVEPVIVPGSQNGLLTHPEAVAKAILTA